MFPTSGGAYDPLEKLDTNGAWIGFFFSSAKYSFIFGNIFVGSEIAKQLRNWDGINDEEFAMQKNLPFALIFEL